MPEGCAGREWLATTAVTSRIAAGGRSEAHGVHLGEATAITSLAVAGEGPRLFAGAGEWHGRVVMRGENLYQRPLFTRSRAARRLSATVAASCEDGSSTR